MPQPEMLVMLAHEKFDAAGTLTDESTRGHLVRYLEALLAWGLRFRTS